MLKSTDARILNPNSKQYILEELAVLEGSVAEGLGFVSAENPNGHPKQSLFIVYPGSEDEAFIQAKQQFKQFDTPKNPFLFDVHWLKICLHLHQVKNTVSLEKHCWTRFDDSAKKLFETKDKNLLFLISLGKKYHEGNCLQATVNLFENAISGCVDLINQERLYKKLNKTNIDNAKGKWKIRIVVADTLQAYNDPQFDTQKTDLKKRQFDLGYEWIKIATPIFEQLQRASQNLFEVDIQFLNWDTCMSQAENKFSYQKYYLHLLHTYNFSNTSTEAYLLYNAVRKKGFEFLDRIEKRHTMSSAQKNPSTSALSNVTSPNNIPETNEAPQPAELTESKQLIGFSDPQESKNPKFVIEQCRIVKNLIYGLNHLYTDPVIEHSMISAGVSIPFHLPNLSNSHCVYRKQLQLRLHELLHAQQINQTTSSLNIIMCYGAGGVGKSHLVARYAENPNHHYTLRILLNCRSESDLMLSFNQLGRALMITEENMKYDDVKNKVITWLTENPGWLIIMDDIYNLNAALDHLPQKNSGHVIITSREKPTSTNNALEIDVMSKEDAINLFTLISERNENTELVNELVKKLSYLPLAIELVAAHLKSNPQILIQDFMHEYETSCSTIMSNKNLIDIAEGIAYKPITATYQISINRIRQLYKDKEQYRNIAELLEKVLTVCAFLSADNIPVNLLKDWFKNNCGIPHNSADNYFDTIMTLLINHSFIKFDQEKKTISLHSVLQDVVRAKHYKSLGYTVFCSDDAIINKFAAWLDTISKEIVDVVLDDPSSTDIWPTREESKFLLPHITKVINYYPTRAKHTHNAIKIQIASGHILLMLNEYKKVITTLEPLLPLISNISNVNSGLYIYLAIAYENTNNVSKAKDLLLKVIEKDTLHPETMLKAKLRLATLYSLLREPINAKKILNDILPQIKASNKDDSENYCDAIIMLSEIYLIERNYLEAKKTGESILNTCRTKKYLSLLNLAITLSYAYAYLGHTQQAKLLLEEAINIKDLVGPSEIIERLKAKLKLAYATISIERNNNNSAETHRDALIQEAKSILGEESKLAETVAVFNRYNCERTVQNEIALLKFMSTMKSTPGLRKNSQMILNSLKMRSALDSQSDLELKLRNAATNGLADALEYIYIPAVRNINSAGNISRKTALHCAVIYGSKECVRLLLANGSDPTLKDKDGMTSIDYAIKKSSESDENAEILDMLKKYIPAQVMKELSKADGIDIKPLKQL